jgi:hypothetical protein
MEMGVRLHVDPAIAQIATAPASISGRISTMNVCTTFQNCVAIPAPSNVRVAEVVVISGCAFTVTLSTTA